MKKIAVFSLITMIILVSINAQPNKNNQNEPRDTIFRLGGKKLVVNVVQVNHNEVDYMFDTDPEIYSISRKQIQKIVYKNGRVEVFNKPVFIEIDETSWEAVLVTEDPEEVQGLYNRGKIDANSSPGARSKKSAKNSAIIRLQKKAANKKGAIVLITHKEARGGYGEMPGYYMEGEVYGYEPLEEEDDDEIDIDDL